jgi:hypothetical protein
VWPVVSGGKYPSTAKLHTWMDAGVLETTKTGDLAHKQLEFFMAHCRDSPPEGKLPLLRQMLEQKRQQSASTIATKLRQDFKQARAQWWFGAYKDYAIYKKCDLRKPRKPFIVRKWWNGAEFVSEPLCVSWDATNNLWHAEVATSCLSLYRGTVNINHESELFRMHLVGFYSYVVNITRAIQSRTATRAFPSTVEEVTVDAESVVAAERSAAAFETVAKTCAIAALHCRCWQRKAACCWNCSAC